MKSFYKLSAIGALTLLSTAISAETLEINRATGSGTINGFSPSNVIDGDLSFDSRWAGNGNPQEVRLDLGSDQRVDNVEIAWGRGDGTVYEFEIAGRSGTRGAWTTVFSGSSSGTTNNFEDYNIEDITARQIRVRGLDEGTTNITEIMIIGAGGNASGNTNNDNDNDTSDNNSSSDNNNSDDDSSDDDNNASSASDVNIVIASSENRSNTSNLSGQTLSDDVFILIDQADQDEIDQVIFFIDGARISEENLQPFDLQGGGSAANPFDTSDLSDDGHTLTANILFNNGSTDTVSVNFEVANASESTPTPVAPPAPSPEPAPTTQVSGNFGLDPNLEPWENFDLTQWSIDTPAIREDDECRAVRSNEDEWDEFRDTTSSPYFFTHTDGGMRFVSPVGGATTNRSCNSGFPRSELREQLRTGDTSISTTGVTPNNWALGYQPTDGDWGGRNGELTATLRINRVTTTGNGLHPGRTIIGQIHASDDEPARLYYRKLPDATFGCVYFEHEIDNRDNTFNLIGDERCDDNDGDGPSNGIELDELFSYEIINEGADITVIIRTGDFDGTPIAELTINMNELDSGYDTSDEWMYFKAGVYTQNNTGDDDDTDIATFYRISNTHDEN